MRKYIAAMAVAALTFGIASAQSNQEPAPAAPATSEKKICRSIVPTGSFLAKRMCLTKAEWAEFASRNDRDVQRVRDKNHAGTPPPFGYEKGY